MQRTGSCNDSIPAGAFYDAIKKPAFAGSFILYFQKSLFTEIEKIFPVGKIGHNLELAVTLVKFHICFLCVQLLDAETVEILQSRTLLARQRFTVEFTVAKVVDTYCAPDIGFGKVFFEQVFFERHREIRLQM